MSFTMNCPGCQSPLQLSDQHLGRALRCPGCQHVFEVPAPKSAGPQAIASTPPPPPPAQDEMQYLEFGQPPSPSPPPPTPARRPVTRSAFDDTEVVFDVKVVRDTDRKQSGKLRALLTSEGLGLYYGDELDELFPRGTEISRRKDSRLHISVGERSIVLQVTGFSLDVQRLTTDLVRYLQGRSEEMDPNGYSIPVMLFVLAILPIGIPIITRGGGIPGALGGGLAGGCLTIARKGDLSVAIRFLAILGLNVVGYAILILMVHLAENT